MLKFYRSFYSFKFCPVKKECYVANTGEKKCGNAKAWEANIITAKDIHKQAIVGKKRKKSQSFKEISSYPLFLFFKL